MPQSFVEDVEFDLIKGPFQGHTSEKHSIGTLSKGKYFPLGSVNGAIGVLLGQTVPCQGTTNDPNVALLGN